MDNQYLATLYCNEEKIATREGDDVDLLYAWMLSQVEDNFGNVHGDIIDSSTNKIVKTFQKSYID